MPPTPSTVVATPTSLSSAKSPTHQVSIPAMVVLALFLSMMAALAIGVILRQRKVIAATKRKEKNLQDEPPSALPTRSWFSRFNPRSTAAIDTDDPTTVGALHAASVLLAAAPCQVFSSPMTMHFRIPLEDKTILILGAPWLPVHCGAQYWDAPASDCHQGRVDDNSNCDHTLPDLKVPLSTNSIPATDHRSSFIPSWPLEISVDVLSPIQSHKIRLASSES